jgi:hypothetical protein
MVKRTKMKKHLIVILLCVCAGTISFAQSGGNTSWKESVSIGLKGGINMPRMYYFKNDALQQLPQKDTITLMGGLFVDIPFGNVLALSPEVVYLKRGTDISYEHRSGSLVYYTMSVHYVDFRLPLEVRLPIKPYFQPYLTVGGEVGMRLGGQIHIDRTAPIELNQTIDVGDANMNMIHAGAFAGLGIRSRIGIGSRHILLKLGATVHQGLLDNYGVAEKEGDVPAVNVNAYQVTGWRLPQGLEVTLGVAIPLEKHLEDACATFAKDRYHRRGNRRHLFGY